MTPIGLTFKKEGIDKYTDKPKQGEIMLIHQCVKCGKVSINRISGDDSSSVILQVFERSMNIPKNLKEDLKRQGIDVLTAENRGEVEKQLLSD